MYDFKECIRYLEKLATVKQFSEPNLVEMIIKALRWTIWSSI